MILVRTLSDKELGDHVLTVVVHDLGFPNQLANQTLLFIHVYRGNQSALATPEGDAFRNTLLVVVIVAVTVVLSVAVVVTMVMMKRNDRQRRLYRAKEEECKVGCCGVFGCRLSCCSQRRVLRYVLCFYFVLFCFILFCFILF